MTQIPRSQTPRGKFLLASGLLLIAVAAPFLAYSILADEASWTENLIPLASLIAAAVGAVATVIGVVNQWRPRHSRNPSPHDAGQTIGNISVGGDVSDSHIGIFSNVNTRRARDATHDR
jgi:hypothetical protein